MPLQLHISIMIICATVASIPILLFSLLILLQMPFPFPISMLMLPAKHIWLINRVTHLRENFLWDKGVSTNAVTFWWWLCGFYAKKFSKHLKSMTKLHWNKLPSWMTWLPGYKLDEGFHRQQHAVNYVLLCLIAKAEAVLHLCIDEFLLLYQISVIFPPAEWLLKFLSVCKLRWIFWSDSYETKKVDLCSEKN